MVLFPSGQPPSLPELLRLKVPQEVGANHFTFGIFLLNDQTGSQVRSFKKECQGDPEDVMFRILQEWLQGKGLPVTWESLVQTLRDTGLSVPADQIQASKMAPRNVHSPQSPDTPNSTHHTSRMIITHHLCDITTFSTCTTLVHTTHIVFHVIHLYIRYIISSFSHIHSLDVDHIKFLEAYCWVMNG